MNIDRDQLARQLLAALPQLRTDAERYDLIRRNLELAFTSGQYMATEDLRRLLGNSAQDYEELASMAQALPTHNTTAAGPRRTEKSSESDRPRRAVRRFRIPGLKSAFSLRGSR
ncbi:MAG: hypothetical protein ACR2PA_09400 [Hyphomicrobiaceae bacterium]